MKICVFLSAIVLALSVSSSLSAAVQSNPPENSNPSNEANVLEAGKFAKSVNIFSATLFKAEADNIPGNLIISPLSVNSLLTRLTSAASGETKEQLESLNKGVSTNDLNQGFQQLLNKFNSSANNGFSFANAEFVLQGQKLQSVYEQNAQQYYGSETDIFSNAEQAAQKSNNWLNENINKNTTLDEVDGLENPIDVLLNAGNLVAKFEESFYSTTTDYDNFWAYKNVAIRVPFIYNENKYYYGYSSHDNASFIKLPLQKFEENGSVSTYSCYLVVPNKYDDMDTMVNNMYSNYLKETDVKLTGHVGKINLAMPKVNMSSYLELKPSLEQIGLEAPFHTKTANFSSFLENVNLKVDQLSHASNLQISENGIQFSFASKIVGKAVGASGSSNQNSGSSSTEIPNESNPTPDQSTQIPDQSPNQSNDSNESNESNKSKQSFDESNESSEEESPESPEDNPPADFLPIEFRIDRPYLCLLFKDGLMLSITRVHQPIQNQDYHLEVPKNHK